MSWWNGKQDNVNLPKQPWNDISQPVTEMVRRIDEEDKVSLSSISGDKSSWYVDFLQEDGYRYSRIIVGWYGHSHNEACEIVVEQDWMTKGEKSAVVKAVKRWVSKTDTARKLTEREEWCKLMGVNQ